MLYAVRLALHSVTPRSKRAGGTRPLTSTIPLIIFSLSHHQDAADVVAGPRVAQNCPLSATLTRFGCAGTQPMKFDLT